MTIHSNSSRLVLAMVLLVPTGFVKALENSISLNHIESYEADYVYFESHGESREEAGSWTDQVVLKGENIIRTVTRKPKNEPKDLIRTVAADKSSLQPIYIHQRLGKDLNQLLYVEFKDKQMSQFYLANSQSKAMQLSSDFEESPLEVNLQGLFAMALPFKEDKNVSVKGYSMGSNPQLTDTVFENHGEEQITIRDQKFNTWKIVEPKSQWAYWVRKDFPYLIKVSHPSPDGSTLVSEIKNFRLTAKDK